MSMTSGDNHPIIYLIWMRKKIVYFEACHYTMNYIHTTTTKKFHCVFFNIYLSQTMEWIKEIFILSTKDDDDDKDWSVNNHLLRRMILLLLLLFPRYAVVRVSLMMMDEEVAAVVVKARVKLIHYVLFVSILNNNEIIENSNDAYLLCEISLVDF